MALNNMKITPKLIVGLCIVTAGVLFTLDNLGLIDSWNYIRLWPAALIVVGVLHLMQSRSWVGGMIFIGVGSWLLLYNLEIVDVDLWDLWPLVLVLIGAHLVWNSMGRPGQRPAGSPESSDANVNAFAMMGGIERKNGSSQFQGADLTAIMGGCELDLRQARLAPGEVVIDTFAMWGGVVIKVPPTWTVDGKVTPIMGAYEDKTQPSAEPTGRITVRGMVIMGGVEVQN